LQGESTDRAYVQFGAMDSVRPRTTMTSASTASSIEELLRVAGVSPSNTKAAAWLGDAIEGAASFYRIAKQRPLVADHNARLADIEKSAKELIKRIERLRRHPVSARAFWYSGAFGPVHNNRVEVREVLSTLETVVSASGTGKVGRKGRQREVGKQNIVNLAFAFFVRFSRHRASGTPTGAFAKFAREFYSAVTGVDPEKRGGGIDRQIRQAMTRLPIERQRAQRMSVK
jgi:hypothetical protein